MISGSTCQSVLFTIGKLHKTFSFHACTRSFYAKIHAQKKPLCRICAQRFSYYGSRTSPDAFCSYQWSWNNLAGIFLTVLKLFASWNIIPCLSTNNEYRYSNYSMVQARGGNIIHEYSTIIPQEAKDKAKN
jgi:hypothetical protein